MTRPITVAYYYRVRWGALDEFIELFERGAQNQREHQEFVGVERESDDGEDADEPLDGCERTAGFRRGGLGHVFAVVWHSAAAYC